MVEMRVETCNIRSSGENVASEVVLGARLTLVIFQRCGGAASRLLFSISIIVKMDSGFH